MARIHRLGIWGELGFISARCKQGRELCQSGKRLERARRGPSVPFEKASDTAFDAALHSTRDVASAENGTYQEAPKTPCDKSTSNKDCQRLQPIGQETKLLVLGRRGKSARPGKSSEEYSPPGAPNSGTHRQS